MVKIKPKSRIPKGLGNDRAQTDVGERLKSQLVTAPPEARQNQRTSSSHSTQHITAHRHSTQTQHTVHRHSTQHTARSTQHSTPIQHTANQRAVSSTATWNTVCGTMILFFWWRRRKRAGGKPIDVELVVQRRHRAHRPRRGPAHANPRPEDVNRPKDQIASTNQHCKHQSASDEHVT